MVAMQQSPRPSQPEQSDGFPGASRVGDDLLIGRYITALIMVARVAGCAAIALGCLALVAWQRDAELAKRIFPGLAATNPLTALTMLCSGAALLLLRRHQPDSPAY